MRISWKALVPLVVVLAGVLALPGVALSASWRTPSADGAFPSAGLRWRSAASALRPQLEAASALSLDGHRVSVPAPGVTEFDPATRTLYVGTDSGDIFVIDAERCNARRDSGCGDSVVATISGAGSSGMGVDATTATLYAANYFGGTLSVIDTTTCNARDTSGCAQTPPKVAVGEGPTGVAINPATHTLYVGNERSSVTVVDTASCNRSIITGCGQTPASFATEPGPIFPTVDPSTGTLYVPQGGAQDGPGGTEMAVIDAATCNATTTAGCAPVAQAAAGAGPLFAVVDTRTHTVFVEDAPRLAVSIVNGATCNAHVTSGCSQTPPTVAVGADPNSGMVLDDLTRTLYVVNTGSDTLSAVDIRRCHAGDTSGCARRSPTIATGLAPFGVSLDPATGSLYVPEYGDNDVAALDARACNAQRRTGCRHEAPAVTIPDGVFSVAVDPVHHTLLSGGGEHSTVSLLDTRTCRARHVHSCRPETADAEIGPVLRDIVVDVRTHSAYAADSQRAQVQVLDTSTCHAGTPSGCQPVATVATGALPIALALNRRTHTVYSANLDDGTVSVIDGAHCSAVDHTACATPAPTFPAGPQPFGVAVEPKTNTVYVSDFDFEGSGGVSVLDGTACEAGSPACSPLTQIPVGEHPIGLGIDRTTRTLYVANQADNDAPGSVSVVDLRRCTAADASGCAGPFPTTPAGRGTWAIQVDPHTHTVYAANVGDASVSIIQGASCNARSHRGCNRKPPRVPIGDIPLDLALDAAHNTLYTADAPERAVSIIDTRQPCRAPVRCLH